MTARSTTAAAVAPRAAQAVELSVAERQRLSALSALLHYPGEETAGAAEQVELGARFRQLTLPALQELYGSTFDLQPSCAPYVGHQLLGEESGLRGPFLAKLADVYRAAGYRLRADLADHVAEVLGFLAVAPPSSERDDLVRDGLLPALRKMIESFTDSGNPYRDVLVVTEHAVRDSAPWKAAAWGVS